LPYQSRAAAADGETKGDLTRANRRPAREETGDVRTRDEQHGDRQPNQDDAESDQRRVLSEARVHFAPDDQSVALVRRGVLLL
jgi:hypothetical protein